VGSEDEDFGLSTYTLSLLQYLSLLHIPVNRFYSCLFYKWERESKKMCCRAGSDSPSRKYLIQCNAPRIALLMATGFLHSAKRVTDSSGISFRLSFRSCMIYVPSFPIDMNRNKNKNLIPLLESRVSGINQSHWRRWLFCGDRSRCLFSLAVSCTLKTNSFVFSFLFLLRLKQNTSILTTNSSQDLVKISKVIKPTECV